jgi:hypothetical protein
MNNDLTSLLSEEQKAVALTALKWICQWLSMDISNSDELLPKCSQRLRTNYQLLNFDPTNILLKKYEDEEAESLLFSTLTSIPATTKSWFVVETYMTVSAEGEIPPRAMQVALMFCEKIGISEKIYFEIIKQAYIMTGDYQEGMFDI